MKILSKLIRLIWLLTLLVVFCPLLPYFRDYDPKTGRYVEPDPVPSFWAKFA